MSQFDNMQEHHLDGRPFEGEGRRLMTRTPLLLVLAAAAALAGCNKESHTIVGGGEPADNDTNIATKAPVALPPSITDSKVYRCADNNVVYVDWLSDNKSANVRTEKTGNPTVVTAPAAGQPMTAAGGYSVEGTAAASSIKIAVPGHPAQSCKV
jgi:predicted small secreted protein